MAVLFKPLEVVESRDNAMPYIPADNVCQAELFQTWDTQSVENVLHFRPNGSLTPTKMTELGAHIVTWWNTYIKGAMPTTLQLTQIKLTDLTLDIGPVVNHATGLPLAGTNGSPSLPNNCAIVLTKRTLLRGRSFRGRIYVPGLVEAYVTGNTYAPGNLATTVTDWSRLLTFTTASDTWDMVVVSRYNANAPRVNAVITEVSSLDSDGVIDSQRRRLPKRGA